MADPRSAATRTVYEHLRRAAFRECLTVQDGEGDRPVVIALPNDPIVNVLIQVKAAGGRSNVVMARPLDLLVFAVAGNDKDPTSVQMPVCGTIGEFIENALREDSSPHGFSTTPPISVPVPA